MKIIVIRWPNLCLFLYFYLPVLPELYEAGHAEDIEVEAYPGEGEDDPQAPEHQAVKLDNPAEGGQAGAVELHREAVIIHQPGRGALIRVATSLIT